MAKPTKGRKAQPGNPLPGKPQDQRKHPEQWQRDLNPEPMAGQNIGRSSAGSHPGARTVADIKSLVERLSAFANDELEQIPIVAEGTRLKQGAVYLDLRDPAPVPITATGEMSAGPGNYYTPKTEVPYELWNRVVEALGPAKIGSAESGAAENKPFTPQRAAVETEVGQPGAPTGEGADSEVDEASAQSFPASDPPGWTTGRDK